MISDVLTDAVYKINGYLAAPLNDDIYSGELREGDRPATEPNGVDGDGTQDAACH